MNFTQNQKSEISQKVIILAICLSNIYYNSTKFPLTLRLINPSHPLLGNDGVCDLLPSLLDIVMFHVNACIIVHFGTQEEFGSREDFEPLGALFCRCDEDRECSTGFQERPSLFMIDRQTGWRNDG